jgi:hypothetical protein
MAAGGGNVIALSRVIGVMERSLSVSHHISHRGDHISHVSISEPARERNRNGTIRDEFSLRKITSVPAQVLTNERVQVSGHKMNACADVPKTQLLDKLVARYATRVDE